MSMYMIDGIILFLVGIVCLTITVIKPFDKPKNSYITILSCAFIVCSFVLFAEDFLQKDEEVENKAHSVIEENYEDCTFADDNTFYWHLRDDEHDPMLCNLLSAAFARQHSDYRFGMNISEAASLKMKAKVACGRVKTPILAMVYRRENEIRTYKPKTVYGIKAIYEEGFSGILSEAMKEEESEESNKDKEEKKEEKDTTIWFDTKKKAEDFIGTLSKNGTVKKYEKKEVKTYPPKLFKLSTIQVEGGKYGIKANDTLKIIQSLYENTYCCRPQKSEQHYRCEPYYLQIPTVVG